MPAKDYISVNLLSKDPFSQSLIGKILMWALSIGRYIVVFTELVVILSFVSRFTLDRQLTDLNAKINQQLLVIDSYGDLETRFRTLQDTLSFVKSQTSTLQVPEVLDSATTHLPPDVKLGQLSVKSNSISLSGVSLTTQGLSGFVSGLRSERLFEHLELSNITSDTLNEDAIAFDIVIDLKSKGGK